ncbi:hypothetical protein CC85DRAFT_282171 [Cutaneotrichosporon oleaginosum]|uniref:MATH domain-containing protein n=1 Tax=Cutaneotrichosporon oleaginosum TaxID=879819 RepID=A0A0J1BDA2_9TREE|nr:uncharacterized protein CC85DRAFT_282171 [Cutaneotrichosporon oleaginosum]KLT46034.1 hypothetical protein CC85DRAFT_282171 [Cutaneotrichosporon oleaginosum]TXT06728.1 hypothetical protein COLE_06059 [Cutaneotrichosporon oleaginosum]
MSWFNLDPPINHHDISFLPPPDTLALTMAATGAAAAIMASTSRDPADAPEFNETTTVSLEWKLTGLRSMYESSKGDMKSKCIKSAIFGDPDNLWEVLFYPNAGVKDKDSDQYFSSLYLWCVPTQQEREEAISGKWVRKGLWWFRFEVRAMNDANKSIVLGAPKDASNHTFAAETATNWGWQKFATRDLLFKHQAAEQNDFFTIICTITSQPQPPAGHWLGLGIPQRPVDRPTAVGWTGSAGASSGVGGGTYAAGGPKRVVPRDLISCVGDMLDDPLYSDVEFIIPAPKGTAPDGKRAPPRKIYASKKMLARCDYFEAMFHGGFGEADGSLSDEDDGALSPLSDSDAEEEAVDLVAGPVYTHHAFTGSAPKGANTPPGTDGKAAARDDSDDGADEGSQDAAESASAQSSQIMSDKNDETQGAAGFKLAFAATTSRKRVREDAAAMGPRKTRVVVRDAAWSTWWAVLYWLYTDVVYFAPLTSSFGNPKQLEEATSFTELLKPISRREWMQRWLNERRLTHEWGEGPVGPRPVSAKAVYRLADKLDLPALKLRAFQHIISQLTPYNIPTEVFSRFSTLFDEVRQVELAFFLKHWAEIKKSDAMKNIWSQIRSGKHVGFEEVWPIIMSKLDYQST